MATEAISPRPTPEPRAASLPATTTPAPSRPAADGGSREPAADPVAGRPWREPPAVQPAPPPVPVQSRPTPPADVPEHSSTSAPLQDGRPDPRTDPSLPLPPPLLDVVLDLGAGLGVHDRVPENGARRQSAQPPSVTHAAPLAPTDTAPTPGLAELPVEAAERLVRGTNATVDAALTTGAATGGGPAGAGAMIRVLGTALVRDADGRTRFDITEQALVDERGGLERELRRRGSDPSLIQRLLSNILAQGTVQRERERVEGLLSLMVSITLGTIPKGTINRLVELGFGEDVQRAMREAIGNGRHLTRGAIRDLLSLASSGLGSGPSMPSVGAAPEHQTEDSYREEDQRLEHFASATGGARLVDARGRTLPHAPHSAAGEADLSTALRTRAASISW